MGQKTNSNSLRLGFNKKNWETYYLDNTFEESSFFLYNSLEIKKYLERFFHLYKVKIHNCKLIYCSNSLYVFVSFYLTIKTISLLQRKKCNKDAYFSTFTNQKLHLNSFKETFLESLSIYLKKKYNIFFVFENLNEHKKIDLVNSTEFKNLVKQLHKFSRHSFFKEFLNILIIIISKRKSAKLLGEFISDQIQLNQVKTDQKKIAKKDNYFLVFLKQALQIFINSQLSSITGIKIVLKGRFNKVPRSSKKVLQFGQISLQTLRAKLDFSHSIAFTPNGTFGVKVWICES